MVFFSYYLEGGSSNISPKKKVDSIPKSPPLRQPEILLCPFPDCDSQGHISGKFDTHCTVDACPTFHNKSIDQCKVSLPHHNNFLAHLFSPILNKNLKEWKSSKFCF